MSQNPEKRYGIWAGNRKGQPEDPNRCIASVYQHFISCQCSRKRGHGPDGLYCKQHGKKQATADAARE